VFLGENRHAVDDKGRVILPSQYRDDLGDGAVLTKEVDGCIAVWRLEDFTARAEEMAEKRRTGEQGARAAVRTFFATAERRELDRQGRVAIPESLRTYAALQRDVVISGQFDRIEIWDVERWRQREESGDEVLVEGTGPL
jgi:MraZ protein